MRKKILVILVGLLVLFGLGVFLFGYDKITNNTKNKEVAINPQKSSESQMYIDLSTPEKTLESYIKCLQKGDRESIIQCFGGKGFQLSKPVPIKSYSIIKRILYTENDINNLITTNQMPSPPYQVGDIEFNVKVIYKAGNSEGPISYKDGQEEMFSYWLRKVNEKWIIVSLASWDQD